VPVGLNTLLLVNTFWVFLFLFAILIIGKYTLFILLSNLLKFILTT